MLEVLRELADLGNADGHGFAAGARLVDGSRADILSGKVRAILAKLDGGTK